MKSQLIAAGLCTTLLCNLSAHASSSSPSPAAPKPAGPGPAIQAPALPSTIKGISYTYAGSNVKISVQGINGEASCGLLIQRQPQSSWDPVQSGQAGVVMVVGKTQRLQLPLTTGYGTGIAPKETQAFSAKGIATAGVPPCAGSAETPYNGNVAPPPPPDVNP